MARRSFPTTNRIQTIEPTILSPSGLSRRDLDPDAVRSLQRLNARGHEAYLVGGCVRDLLLGHQPKDFDIATSARPQQVKRTFPRNCRIIGRRFKLAHLHFHQNTKILEVATFRRAPEPDQEDADDLLITRDNEFGSTEEDALRRDFTINALFFDPIDDKIIDYTGGLADVDRLVLRTIGDPEVRFREDPVRILRAAKFAGRLGFSIDGPTLDAMQTIAPDLARTAPPRMLEEILRLLRGGHALDSFQLLRDIGAIGVMLPTVGEFLADAEVEERRYFWRLLEALDEAVANGRELSSPVLLGALFERTVALAAKAAPRRSATTIAEELLAPIALDLRLPRRDAGCLKRICGVQQRFSARGRKRFKTSAFVRDPYFVEAWQLFELGCMAGGDGFDDLRRWREIAEAEVPGLFAHTLPTLAPEPEPDDDTRADDEREAASSDDDAAEPRRRRRRRRRGRASAAESTTAESASRDSAEEPSRNGRRGKKKTRSRSKTTDRDGTAERAGGKKARGEKAGGRTKATKKKTAAKKTDKRTTDGRGKRRRSRQDKVETIEPEAIDLSAFDEELDPRRRAPTFGVLVEGTQGKKKRVPRVPRDDDAYKPPPPPGPDAAPPPPPPPGDDEYGDW